MTIAFQLSIKNKQQKKTSAGLKNFSDILNKGQRKSLTDAVLTPVSWAYGAGVWVRNAAFEVGLLHQTDFDIPVVSVGNIAIGGTGKTPHVEYIIEALHNRYHIGVLSRGYKRHTHGFVMARDTLTSRDLGDEPYQIYHKFQGMISLAVCESRVKGIKEMLKVDPDINLFVLDDAFQHRYVEPKVNILLMDYNHMPYDDRLMPLGNLREPISGINRADIVVVTKCPANLKPIDIKLIKQKLELYPSQQLFFSNVKYARPRSVFGLGENQLQSLEWLSRDDTLLGVTGIATPLPFMRYLRQFGPRVKMIHYADHHNYTRNDFRYIAHYFSQLEGKRKFIITTEKDAVRLLNNPYFPLELRRYFYYVPIQVGFLIEENHDFTSELIKLIERTEQTPRLTNMDDDEPYGG